MMAIGALSNASRSYNSGKEQTDLLCGSLALTIDRLPSGQFAGLDALLLHYLQDRNIAMEDRQAITLIDELIFLRIVEVPRPNFTGRAHQPRDVILHLLESRFRGKRTPQTAFQSHSNKSIVSAWICGMWTSIIDRFQDPILRRCGPYPPKTGLCWGTCCEHDDCGDGCNEALTEQLTLLGLQLFFGNDSLVSKLSQFGEFVGGRLPCHITDVCAPYFLDFGRRLGAAFRHAVTANIEINQHAHPGNNDNAEYPKGPLYAIQVFAAENVADHRDDDPNPSNQKKKL
jgi:hypothetical protein